MIKDSETNFVYISDLLKTQSPNVFNQLTYWFEKLKIRYAALPNTKDLWVVDFMPFQIKQDCFLNFKYDPDYLKPKRYQNTKTDQKKIYNEIGLSSTGIDIVLDGGNVVKYKNKVILTTKVFKENPDYPKDKLMAEIKKQLQIDHLIIIPQEPGDFVGHTDGMVRFIGENAVLVNQYPDIKKYNAFNYRLRFILNGTGLNCIEFPYTSWQNKDDNDATGCYINFLEVGEYIFYPTFGQQSDEFALLQLKNVFKERGLIGIDCCELAKFGGVLNCATWNIWKN